MRCIFSCVSSVQLRFIIVFFHPFNFNSFNLVYLTISKRLKKKNFFHSLCAKVVLNIKWQQLPDDDQGKVNFSQTIANTHQQLVNAGFNRFELLTHLMENPWTDPILSKIMSGDEKEESSGSDTETEETEREKERKLKEKMDEIANYMKKEDPLILKLRVEMLILENCEDFASNLCNCLVKYEPFRNDLDVREMQFVLLHKLNHMDKLQEECEQIVCHFGIKIINRLEQKESNQKLCIRLVQIFLVQDWINPDINCCTKELIKLWIRHQYMADKDRSKFLENVWSIAKLSCKTEQICVLVTGLQKECGAKLRQLYTDLCVYAINLDKGGCEQEMMQGNMDGVKDKQKSMAFTCEKLANIVAMTNLKAAKISALTAFALNPTKGNLHLVEKMYLSKTLNQASNKRKERIHKGKDMRVTHDGEVNLATLYEVERLLNMLRPYYLNPDLSWPELLPVCQKFMIEKGTSDIKENQNESKEKMSNSVKDGLMQYYCDDTTQYVPNKQTSNVKPLTGVSPPKSPWTSVSSAQNKPPVKESTKLIPYSKLQNMSIQGSPVSKERPADKSKSSQPKRPRGRPRSKDFLLLVEASKNKPQMQVPSKTPSTQTSPKPSSSKTLSSNFQLPYVPGLTTEEVQRALIQHKNNLSRTLSLDQQSTQKHSSSHQKQSNSSRTLSLERQHSHPSSGSSQYSSWSSSSVTDLSKASNRPRIIPDRSSSHEKSSSLMSFQDSFPGKVDNSALHNIIQSNQIEVANEVTLTGNQAAITTTLPARRSRQPSKEELQSIVDWLQTGTEDAKIKSSSIVVKQSGGESIGLMPKQKKPSPITNTNQENSNQYLSFGTSPNQAFLNAQMNQQQLKIQPKVSKNFASQVMSKVGIKPGMSEEEINIAQIKALLRQKQEEKQKQQQKQLQMAAASKGFLLIPGSANMLMQAKMQGQRTKLLTTKQKLKEAQKTSSTTVSTAAVNTSTNIKPQTNIHNMNSHEGYNYVNQMIQSTKHNVVSSKANIDLSTQPTLNLGAQPIFSAVSSQTSSSANVQTSKVSNKYREVDIQHALQSLSKVLDKSTTVLNQTQILQGKSKKAGDKTERPIRPASAMPNMMSSTTIVVTSQTNSAVIQSNQGLQTSTLSQNQSSANSHGQNSAYQLLYLGQIKTGNSTEVSNVATTLGIPSKQTNQSMNISNQGVGVQTMDLPSQNLNNQNVGIPNVLSTNLLVQGNVSSVQPVQEMIVPSVHAMGTTNMTMQGISTAALGVHTVGSQNVSTMNVPALEVQTFSGQGVTVHGIGSTNFGVQTFSSPNLTVQENNTPLLQVQTLASQNTTSLGLSSQDIAVQALGVRNMSTQGFITQPTLNLQNPASLQSVSAPVYNLQGLSNQNTILQGLGVQQVGTQTLSVPNQSIVQCQPLAIQEIGFQTPINNISQCQNIQHVQGQTVFGLPNVTPVSETIGFSNLPQGGVAMNIQKVVPNTTVTFTNSAGLMSSQISTPTNILPEDNSTSVNNIAQTVALNFGNLVSPGITVEETILSTTQTENAPQVSNLMSTALSNLVSTTNAQQDNLIMGSSAIFPKNLGAISQKQQSVLQTGTTKLEDVLATSNTAIQPILIRPKLSASENRQIGPFQLVSNSASERTSNSGYLIPLTKSENISPVVSSTGNTNYTASSTGSIPETNLLDTQPVQPDIVELSPMLHAMLNKANNQTPEKALESSPQKGRKNRLEVVRRVSSSEMNKHYGTNEQENNGASAHSTESSNDGKTNSTVSLVNNLKILDNDLHHYNNDKIECLLNAPIPNASSLNIVDVHITTCNQGQNLPTESSNINTDNPKLENKHVGSFKQNSSIDQVSDQPHNDRHNSLDSNLLSPTKLISDPIQENFWKDFTRFKERMAGCKLHGITTKNTTCAVPENNEKSIEDEKSNSEFRDTQTDCSRVVDVNEVISGNHSNAKIMSKKVTYGELVDSDISVLLQSPQKNLNVAKTSSNKISELGEFEPEKRDKGKSSNTDIMDMQENNNSDIPSGSIDDGNDVPTEHQSEVKIAIHVSPNNKQEVFESTHMCLFESLTETPQISHSSLSDTNVNSSRSSACEPSDLLPETTPKASDNELQNSDTDNGNQNKQITELENEKSEISDKPQSDSSAVDVLEQEFNETETNNCKSIIIDSSTEQSTDNVELLVTGTGSSQTEVTCDAMELIDTKQLMTQDENIDEISREKSIDEIDKSVHLTEAGSLTEISADSITNNETKAEDIGNEHNESGSEISGQNLNHLVNSDSWKRLVDYSETSDSETEAVSQSGNAIETEAVSQTGNAYENCDEINRLASDNDDKNGGYSSEVRKEDSFFNQVEIQLLSEQELAGKDVHNSDEIEQNKMKTEDLFEEKASTLGLIPDENPAEKVATGILQHEINEKEDKHDEATVDEKANPSTPQQSEEQTNNLVTLALEDNFNKGQQSIKLVKPEIGDSPPEEKVPDLLHSEFQGEVSVKSPQQLVAKNENLEEKLSKSFQTNTQEKIQNVVENETDISQVSASITHGQSSEELAASPSDSTEQDNQTDVSVIRNNPDIETQETPETDDLGNQEIAMESEKEDKICTPEKSDLMENYKKLMDEMLNLSASKQNEWKSNRDDDKFSASKSFGFDDILNQNESDNAIRSSRNFLSGEQLPENYTSRPHLARSLPDDWAPGNPKKFVRSISNEERTLKRSFSDVDLSSTDESDFDTRSVISDREYQQKSLTNNTSLHIQKQAMYKLRYSGKSGKNRIALPQLNKEKRKPKVESCLLTYGEWKNKDNSLEIITPQAVTEKVKPILTKTCKALNNEVKVNSEEEENKCKICLRTFDTLDGLRRHVKHPCRQDIRKTVMEIKNLHYETIFTCSGCKTSTKTEFAAKLHCEVCSTGIKNRVDYTIDTIFRCRMCGEAFRYQKTACQHVTKYCKMLPQEQKISSGCKKVLNNLSDQTGSEDIVLDKTDTKENIRNSVSSAESGHQDTVVKSQNITDHEDNKVILEKQIVSEPTDKNEYKNFVKDEIEENLNEKDNLIKSPTGKPNTGSKVKMEIEKDADSESVKSFSTESSYVTIDASETSSIKSGEYKLPRTVQPKHSARLISKQIGKRLIKAKKFFGDQFEVHDYVEKQAKKMNLKRKFKTGYKSGLNISPKLRRALKRKKICKEKNNIKSQWQKKSKRVADHENATIKKAKIEKIKLIADQSGNNFTRADSRALFSFIEYEKHERKVLRCQWRGCNGPFSNRKPMMIHLDKCHQLKTYSKTSDEFKCKFCSFHSDCYDNIMKHSVNHFANLVVENIDGHSTSVIMFLSSLVAKKEKIESNSLKLDGKRLDTDTKVNINISDKTEGQEVLSPRTRKSVKVKEESKERGDNFGVKDESTVKKDQLFTMRTRKTIKQEKTKQNHFSPDKDVKRDVCVDKIKKETKECPTVSVRTRKSGIGEEKKDSELAKGINVEKVIKNPIKLEVKSQTKEKNKKQLNNPIKEKISKNDMGFNELKQNNFREQNGDKIINRRSRKSVPNNKEPTVTKEEVNNTEIKNESESGEKMAVTVEEGKDLILDSTIVRRSSRRKTDGLIVYKDFCLSDQKVGKAEINDQSNQLSSLKGEVTEESSDPLSDKCISTRSGKKHTFGQESSKTLKVVKSEKKDETQSLKSEENVEHDFPCTRNTRKRRFSLESDCSKSSVEGQKKIKNSSKVDKIDETKNLNATKIKKNSEKDTIEAKSAEVKARSRRTTFSDMKLIEGNRKLTYLRSKKKINSHSNNNKIVKKSPKKIIKKNTSNNNKVENEKSGNQESDNAFLDSFKQFVGISKKSSFTNQIKSLRQGKSNKLRSQALLHHRRVRKSKNEDKTAISVVEKNDVEIVDLIEIKDFRNTNKNNSKATSGKVEVIDLTDECQMGSTESSKDKSGPTSNNKKLSFLDSFLAHVNENEGTIPSDISAADRTRKVSGEKEGKDKMVAEKKESVKPNDTKKEKSGTEDNKKDHLKCSSNSKVTLDRPTRRSQGKPKVTEGEKADKKRPKEEVKNRLKAGGSTKASSKDKVKSNPENLRDETKVRKKDVKQKKGKGGDVVQEGKESTKKNAKQKSSGDDNIEIIVVETSDEGSATSNKLESEIVKSPTADSSFLSSFMSYIDFSDSTNGSTSSSTSLKVKKGKPRKKSPFKWDLDDDDNGSSKITANKTNKNTTLCDIQSGKTPVLVSDIKSNSSSDVILNKSCDDQSKTGVTKTISGHCTDQVAKSGQCSTVESEQIEFEPFSSSTEGSQINSGHFTPPCTQTRSRKHSASISDPFSSKQINDSHDKTKFERCSATCSGECPEKCVRENSTISSSGENNNMQDLADGANNPGLSQKTNCDFEKHFVKFISGSLDIDMNTDTLSKKESQNIEVDQESIKLRNHDPKSESKKKVTMETKSVSSNLDPFPLKPKVLPVSNTVKHRTKINFAASHNKRFSSNKSFLVRKTTTNTKLIPISELNVVNRRDYTKTSDIPKPSAVDHTKTGIIDSLTSSSTDNLGNGSTLSGKSDGKVSTSTSQHKLVALDSHRVRHMYHGGKVWQIGQGSVSATNLASPTRRQQTNVQRDSDKDQNSSGVKVQDSAKVDHQSEKSSEKKIEKQSRWKARRSPQKRTSVSENIQNSKKSRNT